jgi:hypothetical protein
MIACSQFCSEWRATPSRAPNATRLAGKRVIYDLLMKAAAETTLAARCPTSAQFPATSCLGAFWTPAG